MQVRRWEILSKGQGSRVKGQEDIVAILLNNRGLTAKKEIDEFLNPNLDYVTINHVAIDKKQLNLAVKRIQEAIKIQEQIVVYGDYDVDGICGSAILWETLHGLGAKVLPYIPHRVDEGYGLSVKGIQNVILNLFQDLKEMPNQVRHDKKRGLIITVDNAIVAREAVDFANKQGIDVIITDHHVPSKKLPKAVAIVHTTKLCGTGVAYMLSCVILNLFQDLHEMPNQVRHDKKEDQHLELVALATIADLVPLLGANRTLTKFGLEKLQKTKRLGLRALFAESGLDQKEIGAYEVGHMIAPRLNAMGRLESAMDSLRLLCTKDPKRAEMLAQKLGSTNKERQTVTQETVLHAITTVNNLQLTVNKKLLFVVHETYQQGVIGLVAGRLVEEFYRPAIVVSKGEIHSKASARSVHGFNIIEFIRNAEEFLVDVGGHPMAAGFTVETEKLLQLQEHLEKLAEEMVNGDHLTRTLRVDCEIDFSLITQELYQRISAFEPFGMHNPQPTFVTRSVVVEDMRLVGKDRKHVKFRFSCHPELVSGSGDSDILQNDKVIDGIAFGFGPRASEFAPGSTVDIVYTIDEDRWNGNAKLQLKIKDIQIATPHV